MKNELKLIEQKVLTALQEIRPFLEADGGDISLEEITEDMVVKVRFHGACCSCSMSSMTLKSGIEETVKRVAPEIQRVVAVENEAVTN
jgi:Fe-S cluster biogenesis protein NfuA